MFEFRVMASFVEMIGSKKRKHEKEEESESLSPEGRSLKVEESRTTSKQTSKDCTKRESFLWSSSSKERLNESSEKGEEDKSDKSYSEGSSSDSEEELLPASKWQYLDLKNTNIFYNDKAEPLKEFMQNVKTDISMEFPKFEKTVEKFCRLTTENLLFSFDFDAVCKRPIGVPNQFRIMVEHSFMADVKTNIERAERVDKELDHTSLFDRKWFEAVERFLFASVSLFKRIVYPEEDENVKRAKKVIALKSRKGKGKHARTTNTNRKQSIHNTYQYFFAKFGELFFLEQQEVDERTYLFGDKLVNCIPDLAYALRRLPDKLDYGINTTEGNRLLFVVEVKSKEVKGHSFECLEQYLDSGVLERVGSLLFAESNFSVLCPNSLGIICMETKIIFVYLKMPKEHYYSIILNKPHRDKGNIHYTKSFDMLNADDRAEVCEFMYWLGCIQNHGTPLMKDIESDP